MSNRTLLALAVAVFMMMTIPAHARQSPHGNSPRSGLTRVADRNISMQEAIARVQSSTGGRVLDARDLGGQYRIKVLTRDGEVRVVRVDPRTGEMR